MTHNLWDAPTKRPEAEWLSYGRKAPSATLREMLRLRELLEADIARTEEEIRQADLHLNTQNVSLPLWSPSNVWSAVLEHLITTQSQPEEAAALECLSQDQKFHKLSNRLPWLKELSHTRVHTGDGAFSPMKRRLFSGNLDDDDGPSTPDTTASF